MRIKIAPENPKASTLIPPARPDGSGVGVNFADAYIKAIKLTLEDGRKVACKRKGLKLTLKVGKESGSGLLRRLEHGPDVRKMLSEALNEAAAELGGRVEVVDGTIFLEL